MRTEEEQIQGLLNLASRLPHQTSWALVRGLGDVVALRVVPMEVNEAMREWIPSVVGIEFVYASGGYDLWSDGHLAKPDLDLDAAAEALTATSRVGAS